MEYAHYEFDKVEDISLLLDNLGYKTNKMLTSSELVSHMSDLVRDISLAAFYGYLYTQISEIDRGFIEFDFSIAECLVQCRIIKSRKDIKHSAYSVDVSLDYF